MKGSPVSSAIAYEDDRGSKNGHEVGSKSTAEPLNSKSPAASPGGSEGSSSGSDLEVVAIGKNVKRCNGPNRDKASSSSSLGPPPHGFPAHGEGEPRPSPRPPPRGYSHGTSSCTSPSITLASDWGSPPPSLHTEPEPAHEHEKRYLESGRPRPEGDSSRRPGYGFGVVDKGSSFVSSGGASSSGGGSGKGSSQQETTSVLEERQSTSRADGAYSMGKGELVDTKMRLTDGAPPSKSTAHDAPTSSSSGRAAAAPAPWSGASTSSGSFKREATDAAIRRYLPDYVGPNEAARRRPVSELQGSSSFSSSSLPQQAQTATPSSETTISDAKVISSRIAAPSVPEILTKAKRNPARTTLRPAPAASSRPATPTETRTAQVEVTRISNRIAAPSVPEILTKPNNDPPTRPAPRPPAATMAGSGSSAASTASTALPRGCDQHQVPARISSRLAAPSAPEILSKPTGNRMSPEGTAGYATGYAPPGRAGWSLGAALGAVSAGAADLPFCAGVAQPQEPPGLAPVDRQRRKLLELNKRRGSDTTSERPANSDDTTPVFMEDDRKFVVIIDAPNVLRWNDGQPGHDHWQRKRAEQRDVPVTAEDVLKGGRENKNNPFADSDRARGRFSRPL